MKIIITLLMMAELMFGAQLSVDKEASSINFEATKMMFIGVDGHFSEFSGTIEVSNNSVRAIHGVIKVASINTDNERRDDHLLSSDFFDETKFDKIIFNSTKITEDSVVANITIKDITKSVTFKMVPVDVSEDHVKIKLMAVVDRTEFDIDNSFMSMMIFNNIDVNALLIAK